MGLDKFLGEAVESVAHDLACGGEEEGVFILEEGCVGDVLADAEDVGAGGVAGHFLLERGSAGLKAARSR